MNKIKVGDDVVYQLKHALSVEDPDKILMAVNRGVVESITDDDVVITRQNTKVKIQKHLCELYVEKENPMEGLK
jgi:hypothetical protein